MWMCAVVGASFAVLAATLGVGASTSFDNWMFRELYAHLGTGWAEALLDVSAPAVSITVLAVVAVVAALLRRWDVAVLAAVGPGGTVLLAEVVFKPLLGREMVVPEISDFRLRGSFPSGHEAAVMSAALVLAIIVCRLPLSRGGRAGVLTGLAVWTVAAALGVVRNFYHYATDTIGAIFLAAAIVPATALAIDSAGAALRRRARAGAA
jgi:undecaprenyl-diphosphatase